MNDSDSLKVLEGFLWALRTHLNHEKRIYKCGSMSSKVYYKQQASKHVKAEEDARKEQP